MILLLLRRPVPGAAAGVRTVLVTPSEILTHTCAVSGYCITTRYSYWNWIRQHPGKGLEWIGHMNYGGGTSYSPSNSRMSISRVTYIQESVLPAAELCDCQGHICVLLCWSHSEGTSVWAQTQTSLWEFSGSAGCA
jgi:hypothetical protein